MLREERFAAVQRPGGEEALDQQRQLPPCAEPLHDPARARGATARHLYRMEAARQAWRSCCWNALRSALHVRAAGAKPDLWQIRQPAVDRIDVQRTEACRYRAASNPPP